MVGYFDYCVEEMNQDQFWGYCSDLCKNIVDTDYLSESQIFFLFKNKGISLKQYTGRCILLVSVKSMLFS